MATLKYKNGSTWTALELGGKTDIPVGTVIIGDNNYWDWQKTPASIYGGTWGQPSKGGGTSTDGVYFTTGYRSMSTWYVLQNALSQSSGSANGVLYPYTVTIWYKMSD